MSRSPECSHRSRSGLRSKTPPPRETSHRDAQAATSPRDGSKVLKNDVERFSERGAQLARRDEGAGRWPVTEEATTPDGMPRPKS
jgi:hypothetical protein